MNLTILICTHNRADLLERTLASLNAAKRPTMPVQILVAANACSDGTVSYLKSYQLQKLENNWIPLRFLEAPTPGKSYAINQALPVIDTVLTAFVDDDHRVDENYLIAIEQAALTWPKAGLYCGRILPDWDGTEPAWVHDEGRYRIFPLPVPRYDQGNHAKTITAEEGPIPGGGNLVVKRHVFDLAGQFSTELGPHGHDLGGGEDSEYVLRAMARGVRCQYSPDILQYHYVDTERLRLLYLLKKGYQRTRSMMRIHGHGRVPLFMWRKFAEYVFHSIFSISWAKRRFYWVRTAAVLGEIQGYRESGNRRKRLNLPSDRISAGTTALALLTTACGLTAWFMSGDALWAILFPALGTATVGTIVLLTKSLLDFSQTGPRIRDEILANYRYYMLFSLSRLCLWAFMLMLLMGCGGTVVYYLLSTSFGWIWSDELATFAAIIGVLGTSGLQLVRMLRFNPGLLVASMHYRVSRLYPLWQWATPLRIRLFQGVLGVAFTLLLLDATWHLVELNQFAELIAVWTVVLFYIGIVTWAGWLPDAQPRPTLAPSPNRAPNILLIGSDTLRADRLGTLGYSRKPTPNIDALSDKGALFTNCYVPCARTAPSLVSLLTGTWPHTHGIRDNFVADSETRLKVATLPQLLRPLGYRSAALSDWCGADMGKLSFGFDHTDLPEDQWNLKYLIRQGPKDLRLFISLFVHNRLGRWLLPELYYLGGVPLTSQLGRRARRLISQLATDTKPFFLNVFYSTTHPPFASEWPWYTKFTDSDYAGESKFAMARLTDPFEIIRRQGAPREEFDLDQIINLYDGCVAQFDDEVGRILRHVEACGLSENTIIVIYSDHGMEFFEHDTWGQGNSVIGDFSPRIPLLIYDPRKPASGKIQQIVRSIDLAPTLLELVDAAPVSNMDGISLVTCLTHKNTCQDLDAFNETGIWVTDIPGQPSNHLRYPDLFDLIEVPNNSSGTMAIKPEYAPRIMRAKDRMIRRGRWKLVYQPLDSGYFLQLFDLESDPSCRRDLLETKPSVKTELWNHLQDFLRADTQG